MKTGAGRESLGLILALFPRQANRRPICLAIASFLVLLGIPANVAAVNFTGPQSYAVGTSPAAIVVGDFNGDGKIDLAVANTGSGDVSILLGNGDGTFQPAVNYAAGNSPTDIAVGDFNGDGKLDLAVFQGASAGAVTVSILLGNGDGTFQAPKTLALTASLGFVAVGDFDGDKKTDLAACDSANLNIFISNGDGTFQAAKSTALSSGCRGLFTADFNNDSKPDLGLITADGLTTGAIQILLGKGDGTFSTGTPININRERRPVVATDLNHDGKVDLVVSATNVSCQSGPPTVCQASADITVFLGNGDGTFQNGQSVLGSGTVAVPSSGNGAPAFEFVIGDFNGDGKLDLAYHLYVSPTGVSGVLLGRGDGSFSTPVETAPPGPFKQITSQDLNGDKLADLIATGPANDVEVWLNTSPTSGADLDLPSPMVSAGPYVVGTNVTFTANLVNQGPQDATGVIFTDTLPSGLTFVSAAVTPGSCVQASGVVSCTIGALASASGSSINIVATPNAVGTVSNTMSVSGSQPDPVLTNNSATQSVTVVPVFTLTVTDAGKGSGTVTAGVGAINCGSTCTGTYPQGTSVSLTATPSASSIFSAWTGACTGTDPNTCTLVMNSAQSVTATFSPAPDFTLAAASTNITLQTGAQTTDTLTLTPQNGLSGQVNLTCVVNGSAPLASCAVSPSSVTLGSSPGDSTLTLTAPSSLSTHVLPLNVGSRMTRYAVLLPVPALLLLGIALGFWCFERRRISLSLLFGSLIALFTVLAGCGGGTPPPPKNFTVTVNATSASGSLQHSTTVNLTVN